MWLSLIMFTGFKKCEVFIISENVKKIRISHIQNACIRSKHTINSFPPLIFIELYFILNAVLAMKPLTGVLIDFILWWERQTSNRVKCCKWAITTCHRTKHSTGVTSLKLWYLIWNVKAQSNLSSLRVVVCSWYRK